MKTTLLAPLLLVSTIGIAALDGDSGIPMWLRLQADQEEASKRVGDLTAATNALRLEIAELSSEPFALERAIREDLELARPGEVIVRFARDARRRTSLREAP